jgi:hypothetical protein
MNRHSPHLAMVRRWYGRPLDLRAQIVSDLLEKTFIDLKRWLIDGHSIKKYIKKKFPSLFEEIYSHELDDTGVQYRSIEAYLCEQISLTHPDSRVPDKTIKRTVNFLDFLFSHLTKPSKLDGGLAVKEKIKAFGPEGLEFFNNIVARYRK